jgi:pimeloyl-ACP methyl ester carboxylesterase
MGHAPSDPPNASDPGRARQADRVGFIQRGGVRSFWELYGEGDPAILFAPTWSIVHSRIWKAQVPDFARRHRVLTLDPRGNGRSDRPRIASAYAEAELADDLLATLDATGTDRVVVVSLSLGAQRSLILATDHPERVIGLVFIAPSVSLGEGQTRLTTAFDAPPPTHEGWDLYNREAWRRDYPAFLTFFFGACFTEPHSTKQIDDAIGWATEIGPEYLTLTQESDGLDGPTTERLCSRIACPTLVVQGDVDAVTGPGRGIALARAIPDARLAMVAGGGHIPNARDPILVNLLIRDFVASIHADAGARGS